MFVESMSTAIVLCWKSNAVVFLFLKLELT